MSNFYRRLKTYFCLCILDSLILGKEISFMFMLISFYIVCVGITDQLMYVKIILMLFVIAVALGGSLLGLTSFANSTSIFNNHQAFANHMNTANSNETRVVHQAIIASSPSPQIEPQPNEQLQSVVVLPYRTDGSIYKGILTFTATKPVEVTLQHRIPLDNTTLSQIDMQKFGNLFVRNLTAFPGNVSAPSRIIPNYSGSASPYFAASIPFVASSVVLRTNGQPFIAAYEVYADIIQQPKIIKHLENATTTLTNSSAVG
jgi:hypothetical protein